MLALIICKDLIKKPKQTHKILKTTTKKALPHILDRKDPLNLPQYSYQKKKSIMKSLNTAGLLSILD